MSLIRAKINCNRCYALAQTHGQDANVTMLGDSDLYAARNEALRALESTCRDALSTVVSVGVDLSMTTSSQAVEALEACAGCDYSKPSIANVVDGKSK